MLYENLTPEAKEFYHGLVTELGGVWAERWRESLPYQSHPAVGFGVAFAIAEARTGHAEHAETFWAAVILGIDCIVQRLVDQMLTG